MFKNYYYFICIFLQASFDSNGESHTGTDEEDDTLLSQVIASDTSWTSLVLEVIGLMCDGQHRTLQNYLRDQPDNFKVRQISQYSPCSNGNYQISNYINLSIPMVIIIGVGTFFTLGGGGGPHACTSIMVDGHDVTRSLTTI